MFGYFWPYQIDLLEVICSFFLSKSRLQPQAGALRAHIFCKGKIRVSGVPGVFQEEAFEVQNHRRLVTPGLDVANNVYFLYGYGYISSKFGSTGNVS